MIQIVKNGDWDKLHDNYPQEINISREDFEDMMDEELNEIQWWRFRESLLDKINEHIMDMKTLMKMEMN